MMRRIEYFDETEQRTLIFLSGVNYSFPSTTIRIPDGYS